MRTKLSYFFIIFFISSCIGVDTIDDPIVGANIDVTPEQGALMPDQSLALMAQYFNQYGIEEKNTSFTWTSSAQDVATVSSTGVVNALAKGQTIIRATHDGTESKEVHINVVGDVNDVATVNAMSPKTTLAVNEKVQLSLAVKTINGDAVDSYTASWFASPGSVITINSTTGEATAIGNGVGYVYAKVDNVKSNTLELMVGTGRMGTFQSATGGYIAEGTVFVTAAGSNLTITLSDNFKTSYALGTYIYLANSTSGSDVIANGKEVMQVTANGPHTFSLSGVGLNDYKYVVIMCKPASLTFGFAELK